jgi:hypothetical protein
MKGLLKKFNQNPEALSRHKNMKIPITKKISKFLIELMMAAKIPNQPKTMKFFCDFFNVKAFLSLGKI